MVILARLKRAGSSKYYVRSSSSMSDLQDTLGRGREHGGDHDGRRGEKQTYPLITCLPAAIARLGRPAIAAYALPLSINCTRQHRRRRRHNQYPGGKARPTAQKAADDRRTMYEACMSKCGSRRRRDEASVLIGC